MVFIQLKTMLKYGTSPFSCGDWGQAEPPMRGEHSIILALSAFSEKRAPKQPGN